MPDKPEILTRKEVCRSGHFRVEAADLRFSNGREMHYEYLCGGGVAPVIIVPIIDASHVLMVQEYGIGIDAYEWTLPKGRVDSGESQIEAANRELKEEAGYGAKELYLLKCMSQSPNYMQNQTQIVLAMDLYPEKLMGDEPEPMAVKAFSLDDISAIAAREDVTEARTIAALYLAKDWLRQKR